MIGKTLDLSNLLNRYEKLKTANDAKFGDIITKEEVENVSKNKSALVALLKKIDDSLDGKKPLSVFNGSEIRGRLKFKDYNPEKATEIVHNFEEYLKEVETSYSYGKSNCGSGCTISCASSCSNGCADCSSTCGNGNCKEGCSNNCGANCISGCSGGCEKACCFGI